MMGISPKDKIGSKGIWLSDTGNNGMEISGLGKVGSILYYDGTTKTGLAVDDNSIGYIDFKMSVLRGIDSSLCYKKCSQRHWGTFKGSPACFYIEFSMLLW